MTVARPLFLQGLTDYSAGEFRALTDAVFANPGVLSGLAVAVTGPASMNITVAPGYAVIQSPAAGGKYLFRVSATETVTVNASGAQPRVDLVLAQVLDSEFTGAVDAGAVMMIPGVPAAAPVPPAVPSGAVLLGTVMVRAGTASITAADLTALAFTGKSGQSGDLGVGAAVNPDTQLIPGTVYGSVTGRGTGVLTTTVAGNAYWQQTFTNITGPMVVWARTRTSGVWTAWAMIGPNPATSGGTLVVGAFNAAKPVQTFYFRMNVPSSAQGLLTLGMAPMTALLSARCDLEYANVSTAILRPDLCSTTQVCFQMYKLSTGAIQASTAVVSDWRIDYQT